jgi:Zn-dependent protease with chaperone function
MVEGADVSITWEQAPARLRNAHDPPVALILWVVFILAVAGAALTRVFDWGSIPDTLTVFGGILVLLGSYFAARTLRETEADRAAQMLASESAAVRAAGVHRLKRLANETPRYRGYVKAALTAYVDEHPASERGRTLASSTLEELQGYVDV